MNSTHSSQGSARWQVIVVVIAVAAGAAWAETLKVFNANTPAIAADINSNFTKVQTPAGVISVFAGNGAVPAGWLLCDGSTFSAGAFPDLATVLGGTTLPDLRGRVIVGLDATKVRITDGAALSVGASGGLDINTELPQHTHTIANDPGHQHGIRAACNNSSCGNSSDGFTRGGGALDTTTFSTLGSGAHNHGGATGQTGKVGVTNLQPFITFRYIIKT